MSEDAEQPGHAARPTGVFDPLATALDICQTSAAGTTEDAPPNHARNESTQMPLVEFFTPSQLRNFRPHENQNMVGDYHFQRGSTTVLAGPPGCGKSRAALWLAILGARGGGTWFGYLVCCRFRTLILQNENGLARLHRDCEELGLSEEIDPWIRISAPPVFGMDLGNAEFRRELTAIVNEFCPELVIIDPWNAVTRDSMEKDYQQSFSWLREVLAGCGDRPACLIIHHLRMPKSEDRHRGRARSNLLAGSYTIISVPRTVFVLQPASDDIDDNRVVITPAKNNDGEPGERSAWQRAQGTFTK